ncbi:MAG: nuclear transport factor 2 family protein [Alphaproteobacteria bacterium]|nr:nuclear transport factor 2 family protein [Alphaproteobacteria bacterium]
MSERKEATETLFRAFAKGFAKKDTALVAPTLADDFVWSQPTGEDFVGKEAALQAMADRWSQPGGGPVFGNGGFEVFGDTVIQTYEVTADAPGGGKRTLRGMDIYKVRDGLLTRKDAFWKQLG